MSDEKRSTTEAASRLNVRLPDILMEQIYEVLRQRKENQPPRLQAKQISAPPLVMSEVEIQMQTMAWVLDIYMETEIPDWKTVLHDINRRAHRNWFKGDRVNITHVLREIGPHMGCNAAKSRTRRKHISAALDIILHDWVIRKPLGQRGLAAAYSTLDGLVSAVMSSQRESISTQRNWNATAGTKTHYLVSKFDLPPTLSRFQTEHCIREALENR